MKSPGLEKVHVNSLLSLFEKKELSPIEAIRIMNITSTIILSNLIEDDMTEETSKYFSNKIESFSSQVKPILEKESASYEDVVPLFLASLILTKELVQAIELISKDPQE